MLKLVRERDRGVTVVWRTKTGQAKDASVNEDEGSLESREKSDKHGNGDNEFGNENVQTNGHQ